MSMLHKLTQTPWRILIVCTGIIVIIFIGHQLQTIGRYTWHPVYQKIIGKQTINDVIAVYGEQAKQRLQPFMLNAGFDSAPERLALLAFKEEQIVEVWGKTENQWHKIKIYSFTATSGVLGPKLQEGDRQIPEGVYQVLYLNPNSSYHLSFKISYPNEFDKTMAHQDGRTNLGDDIFIHGKAATIGCIPVGDPAIEEIFYLVQEVGKQHVDVIIAPVDFRTGKTKPKIPGIAWTLLLYDKIEYALKPFTEESPIT